MNGKSPDAFRTISEVADWLGVNTHVLRFWESKFTQVKPIKRAGGRRYYRPADMELLGGIQKLLHDEGMTIKGVQKVLRDQGVRAVSAMSKPVEPSDAEPVEMNAALEEAAEPASPVLETPQPAEDAEAVAPAVDESEAEDSATGEAGEVQAEPFEQDRTSDALEMVESAYPHAQVDEEEAVEPSLEITASVSDSAPQDVTATLPQDLAADTEDTPEPAVLARSEAFEETVADEPEMTARDLEPEASVDQSWVAPATKSEPVPEPEVAPVPAPESPTMPLFSRRMGATDAEDGPAVAMEVDITAHQDAPEAKGPIIAPLPPADITLTEALERLQPLQVSPALLAPIHARMLALRERMDGAR